MMTKIKLLMLIIFYLIISASTHAAGGIALGATRIIYPADAQQTAVWIRNSHTNERFLVNSWIENSSGVKEKSFIITPPLFVSEPKSENTLRIIYTGPPLAADRESLFWMNVKTIDLISLGGHAGLGVAFAKKKGEMLSDICIYATACGHAGIGGGINAAITYSETKSLPTSGVSNSVGVTVGGGVGGHFAYTYVVDVDNPESSTESVGIGAGVDASVMTLACRTWQECWVN